MRHRTKKIPAQAIKFLETLTIPEGPSAGKRLKLAPFQKQFIAGALDPEIQYGMLSVGRGGGKSALSAGIALGCLLGIWDEQPNREILIAARSREQARIAWTFVRSFIEYLPDDVREQITVRQAPRLEIEFSGSGGGIIKAIAADAKNALGSAPVLVICDEIGHWAEPKGSELFASLESGIGKRGGKMLLISTSASTDSHLFSQLLDNPPSRTFKIEHRPPAGMPLDDMDGLRLANPGAEYGVGAPLSWLKEQAERAIARGGSAAANFRLYNLNQRVSADTREMLLSVDEFLACEVSPHDLPPRDGLCIVGVDIGGSASMSCAAFYWPETGRLEALGAFPSNPDLAARGAADGVGGRYLEMRDRGELRTLGDMTVPIAPWLGDVLRHVEGCNVVALTMDRYKAAELTEAVNKAGLRVPLVWRGQGFRDGGEDAERTRRAVLDGRVKTLPSLLLRSAFADAVVIRDDANNMKITKARSLGRIDAASATVLAVAEGARRIARPTAKPARVVWA